VPLDGAGLELRDADRHHTVVKSEKQGRADQPLERNPVDGLAIVEKVTRRIGVCSGV